MSVHRCGDGPARIPCGIRVLPTMALPRCQSSPYLRARLRQMCVVLSRRNSDSATPARSTSTIVVQPKRSPASCAVKIDWEAGGCDRWVLPVNKDGFAERAQRCAPIGIRVARGDVSARCARRCYVEVGWTNSLPGNFRVTLPTLARQLLEWIRSRAGPASEGASPPTAEALIVVSTQFPVAQACY